MSKEIKWSESQNPIKWHRKLRHPEGMGPDVERWAFNQVYDYALWLQEKCLGKGEPVTAAKELFKVGNVLKSLVRTSSMPLYVMVTGSRDPVLPDSFISIVLLDISEYFDPGEKIHVKWFDETPGFIGLAWELSSLEEVANNAKRVG